MRLSYRLAVGESRLDVELRLKLLQPFFMRSRRDELFAAYNFSIQHARDQCFTELAGAQYCDSLVLKHAVVPQSRTGVARSQTAPTVLIPYCRGGLSLEAARYRACASRTARGPPKLPSQKET